MTQYLWTRAVRPLKERIAEPFLIPEIFGQRTFPVWEVRSIYGNGSRIQANLQLLRCQSRSRLDLIDGNKLGRVDTRVAGGAVGGLLAFGAGLAQSIDRQVSQRIGADILANLF